MTVFIFLSVPFCLSICTFLLIYLYLSIYLSLHLSAYLSTGIYVYIDVNISIPLSIHISFYLCQSVCIPSFTSLSVYQCDHPNFRQSRKRLREDMNAKICGLICNTTRYNVSTVSYYIRHLNVSIVKLQFHFGSNNFPK